MLTTDCSELTPHAARPALLPISNQLHDVRIREALQTNVTADFDDHSLADDPDLFADTEYTRQLGNALHQVEIRRRKGLDRHDPERTGWLGIPPDAIVESELATIDQALVSRRIAVGTRR